MASDYWDSPGVSTCIDLGSPANRRAERWTLTSSMVAVLHMEPDVRDPSCMYKKKEKCQ